MSTVPIALVDFGCGMNRGLLGAIAEAATIHTQKHFGLPAPVGYGTGAVVRVAASAKDVRPGEWVCGYFPHPDVANALGYHDRTPGGQPVMHVFPGLDDPAMRGVTETHEIDEALADPELACVAVGADGVIRAREPGDPVETTWYDVVVGSGAKVRVTNFVTPAWFEPPDELGGVAFDWLKKTSAPGEILSGGYQIVYAPGSGWTQVTNGVMRVYRAWRNPLERVARKLSGLPTEMLEQVASAHKELR